MRHIFIQKLPLSNSITLSDTVVLNDVKKQMLLLPYAGQNGCTLVKELKTHLKKTLPSNIEADIVYTSSPP